MTAARTSISLVTLVLRTLLWLPICLAAWHFSAHSLAAVSGELTHLLVNWILPGLVSALEQTESNLAFVTTLKVQYQPEQTGVLVPEVNSLLYTYGLAFFVALMLAVNAQLWKILAGAIALLFFQSWGITFDLLTQIGIRSGSEIAAQAGIFGWHKEAIALSYQLGNLILPTLMPIVFWISFNRSFIKSLSTQMRNMPTRS